MTTKLHSMYRTDQFSSFMYKRGCGRAVNCPTAINCMTLSFSNICLVLLIFTATFPFYLEARVIRFAQGVHKRTRYVYRESSWQVFKSSVRAHISAKIRLSREGCSCHMTVKPVYDTATLPFSLPGGISPIYPLPPSPPLHCAIRRRGVRSHCACVVSRRCRHSMAFLQRATSFLSSSYYRRERGAFPCEKRVAKVISRAETRRQNLVRQ